MVIGDQEETFDATLKHQKSNERRVLCEKLKKLERMLPHKCTIDRLQIQSRDINEIDEVSILESTEKMLMNKIVDLEENPIIEDDKMNTNANYAFVNINKDDITNRSVSLLHQYSQHLCSNVQSLEQNHAEFTQRSRHTCPSLDRPQNDYLWQGINKSKNQPLIREKMEKPIKCSCATSVKINGSVDCGYDGSVRQIQQNCKNVNHKICEGVRKVHVVCKKCRYYESASSSDSEELCCECERRREHLFNNEKYNMNDAGDSDSSNYSSDCKTSFTEKSNRTCFCSKNYSHDEYSESCCDLCENTIENDTKCERCRGGYDGYVPKTSTIDVEKTKIISSSRKDIVDHFKVIKVEELRQGLERLKIRNRNLKEFLLTLDKPMTFKNSSDLTNSCQQISSCYISNSNIDLLSETRSGLLAVVKILEDKCRNKDYLINALADELKEDNYKQRIKEKELQVERSDSWGNIIENKKVIRKRYVKKESILGFLVIMMILISHFKRFEITPYFRVWNKTLKNELINISVQIINYIKKILCLKQFKSPINYFINVIQMQEKELKFSRRKIYSRLSRLSKSLYVQIQFSRELFRYCCNILIKFSFDNYFYIFLTSGIIFTLMIIFIILKKNNQYYIWIVHTPKHSSMLCILYKSIKCYHKAIYEEIVSSRIFWIMIGFCCHYLLQNYNNFLKSTYSVFWEFDYKSSAVDDQKTVPLEDVESDYWNVLFNVDSISIVSQLNMYFQNITDFLYCLLQNVI